MTMRLAIMAATTMVTIAPVAAQQGSGTQRVLDSLAACRTITTPDARLACYDKAGAALERDLKSRELRIVDRTELQRTRRSLFGLNLPASGLLGASDDSDQREAFTEINTTVRSARPAANGRGEVTLADDGAAVWQTTDPMNFPPKAGARIRIRKGAMGAFFLHVDGRSYRAIRLR